MAKVALMFGIVSFFKMICGLFKLVYLQLSAIKCEGTIGKLLNSEADYKGKKNTVLCTYAVRLEDGTSGTYKELIKSGQEAKVVTGNTYRFYVGKNDVQLVKSVAREPLNQLCMLAVCVAIFLLCAYVANAL